MCVFLSFSVADYILWTKTGKSPQSIARFAPSERDRGKDISDVFDQMVCMCHTKVKYFGGERNWRNVCMSESAHHISWLEEQLIIKTSLVVDDEADKGKAFCKQ